MVEQRLSALTPLVRTLQIIVAALASGVLMFALITVFRPGGGFKPWDTNAIVSVILAIVSIGMIPARWFVPAILVQAATRQIALAGTSSNTARDHQPAATDDDEFRLLAVFQTRTIIAGAILEGTALMNLVAFLLEGQAYSFVLALLCLAGILAGFPTQHAVTGWLEHQLRRVREMRDMPEMH